MYRLCLLGLLFLALPMRTWADGIVLKLEPYAGALRQVAVTIEGKRYSFLFDTGGGYTLISPEIARTLGCIPAGRVAGFRMTGERFDTQLCHNVSYSVGISRTETVGVFDLMALLPKGLPKLDGVVSLLSFGRQRFALDLRSNRIALGEAPNGATFPCRVATGLDGSNYVLFAGIRRGGQLFWFEVDSGNVDAVRVAPHAANAFALSVGANATSLEIALGASSPVRVQGRVIDTLYDGVLGAEFLEQGVLQADFAGSPICHWTPHASDAGGK